MRNLAILLLTATSLAACGSGGDTKSVSANVTVPGQTSTGSGTAIAGSGGGVAAGAGVSSSTAPTGTFLDITAETPFNAVGAVQTLGVAPTGGVIYAGNASTVKAPSGTISYNPRDGIFTLVVTDTKANASINMRYQDPAHRADFSGIYNPTFGVPNLVGFNYIEALGPSGSNANGQDLITFFYQRPGVSANYVSLAGYVRNNTASTTNNFERGAFVFGTPTVQNQVPLTGTGTYTGGFLATMVNDPSPTVQPQERSFQWIVGNSNVTVDFAKASVALNLNGSVGDAVTRAGNIVPGAAIASGSTFTANGTATINFTQSSGFVGVFQSAQFASGGTTTAVNFSSVNATNSTAGASSIDGTFYGPNAINVGGNFRIIGGVPNQRVDILGAFNGAKKP
jgi:C-lobe and N-lobe beta barrels of Tf-binding protein B